MDACSTGANACNWAKKSLLDKYGLSFVWSNPFSVDLKTFHLQFKQRVLDVFKQSWYSDKFTLLMQTKQQGVLQKLGKYVYESFRLRSTLMTS